MTVDELDDLLAARVPAVADNGFSRGVISIVEARERRIWILEFAGLAVAVIGALVVLTIAGAAKFVAGLAVDLSLSLPLAIACAALVLSQSLARALAR